MIIVHEINGSFPSAVATIGFFDGVHRGHQYLIGHVVNIARACRLASTVITFACHPRQVIDTDYVPRMLSTPDMKLARLAETGIDQCVVLDFDRRMAALTAQEFMKRILKDRFNVRKLIIGYDNRFGHDRSEGIEQYRIYGQALGIEVLESRGITVDGIRVSSSVIRKAIERGDLIEANRCLGYAYMIAAHVVHGFRNGHKLGFPTANLDMNEVCQLLPQIGVYASQVRIDETTELLPAMTSVGTRPTFDGTRLSVETHILDFDADLYGRKLEVQFLKRLRGERKFADLQQLQAQLADDERRVRQLNGL